MGTRYFDIWILDFYFTAKPTYGDEETKTCSC
uniref:Uncharacterized protein n=1 Tax=Triticum urartu TaxID=4572 RepID=A0A8R7Q4N2_TRIUA